MRPAVVRAAAVALVVAAAAARFLATHADPSGLWRDPLHDRNTHLLNGLDLALDLAALDLPSFAADAVADPVWPPLHAVVLSLVLLAGGIDHRLAILPSLAGWTVAVLLAGRLAAAAGRPPWFAGAVAMVLALASPAFRLLGSDVMLEGLGAALTALALLVYTRCDATHPGRRRVLALAAVLTCLFLEKFNYWLLVCAALAIDVAVRGAAGPVLATAWRVGRQMLMSWAGLCGLLSLAAAAILARNGPLPLTLLGRGFSLYPGLVLTAGYGILLLRTCQVWRHERTAAAATLPPAALIVLRWHILPVALWLLMPQVLGRFLWFLGPTHRGASTAYDPWAALLFQWQGFSGGFHAPLLAWPVLALAVLGGTRLVRHGGPSRCVAVFAVLSAAVLVLHPQQQWRFQATSLPAVWACAGVGAGMAIRALHCVTRVPAAPLAAGLLALLAIAAAIMPAPLADRVAIRTPAAPSDLELARAYLPLVRDARTVGFVTTFGVSDLFAWTVREACRCRMPVDQPWLAAPGEPAALLDAWLDRTPAELILLVNGPGPGPASGRSEAVRSALDASSRLRPLPGHEAAAVMAWRAAGPPAHPTPARLRIDAMLSLTFAGLATAVLLWPKGAHRSG